jgi:sugar phosphate isomerase/epimerase
MKANAKIEFGDFQTPAVLAQEVCSLLVRHGITADAIVEPTCGVGAFLVAAAEAFPKAKLFGWDINTDYVAQTKSTLAQAGLTKRATIGQQDFFSHDWETELAGIRGSLLVLGNLPWGTNATVSGMNGTNLPAKENFQNFRGIEARTGKSNFDISEWMLIQLVKSLRGRPATIAMLCKTGIARKLLRYAWQNDGRIAKASLHHIDAKKHFGASVDAGLLLVQTGSSGLTEAPVFDDLQARTPSRILGLVGQDLASNVRVYKKLKHLEGFCPYQWRSGVKHDCSSVMELRRNEQRTANFIRRSSGGKAKHLPAQVEADQHFNGGCPQGRKMLLAQAARGGTMAARMKKIFLLATAVLLSFSAGAQTSTPSSADQLGWQLAVHSYTFRKFPIYEAIDKTAALGIHYMSISGSVSFDGTNSISTPTLSDEQMQGIMDKLKSAGLYPKFVNMGVVQLPADEAKSRKVFAFAKKWGIDILVAEPAPDALDTVEKLCKEYNIKVAIHDHPRPNHYWNPDVVLAAIKGRTPLMGDCADVGHWKRSGLDPVECLKKLEGHIICLHFKDLLPDAPNAGPPPANGALKMHDVPWGTGQSDVKAMMAELKRQHFHGAFCVEYEYHWDNSAPEIAECVKFFNATCDQLVAADTK